MSKKKRLEDILLGVLEKELFKEERQQRIKLGVNKLELGEIKTSDLLRIIVHDRADVIEKLLKTLYFYFRHVFKEQEVKDFENSCDINQIKNELREKNEFLALLGCRINDLRLKLKNSYNS